MASIKSKRKASFDVEKYLNTIGSASKVEYRRKPEDIETSEAKTIVQEKAELKQLCNEFAQQVANILRMPSERAQQALNITETLADIRRKIAALGNYGGAGALAALEMMHLIPAAHQEFASAVANGWHNPLAPPN
jgi:hypothetical protein